MKDLNDTSLKQEMDEIMKKVEDVVLNLEKQGFGEKSVVQSESGKNQQAN